MQQQIVLTDTEALHHGLLLALSAAGVGIAGLASLPAGFAILSQLRHRTPRDNFYKDVDGSSTPETVASFSNKSAKAAILTLSIVSFASSISVSVLSTLNPHQHGLTVENWLATVALFAILFQACCLCAHHSPVKSHDLGQWTMGSSLFSIAITFLQALQNSRHIVTYKDPVFVLRIVNIVATILLSISCLTLPRRPDVFYQGRKVDSQWSVSALDRITWTWAHQVMGLARQNGDLTKDEVPTPDHHNRAQDLVSSWHKSNLQGTLLRSLLRAYLHRFIIQWTVSILRCFLGVGPFWAMWRLIQTLEHPGSRQHATPQLLGFVLYLSFFTLAGQWMEGWVNWYSNYRMMIPLRAQLSALIFEKSLRRKNVKTAEKTQEIPESQENDDQDNNKDGETKPSEDDSVLKSRQAIVNLVGVDAKHISQLASMQFFIVSSIGRLIFFSAFLIQIIGWLPFGAGVLAWALVLPINTYATRRYLKYSEQLMKDRDAKLAVVNEALLGIRQIKFSALENQWEKRILASRNRELLTLKKSFLSDTVLFACWVISPILLAAASLATYATMNGTLSPSVAFVSISIFKNLEVTLGVLPELLTASMDTLVSVKRIDTYLQGPEMQKIVSQGPDVAFENASIAWPVDAEIPDEDRFILNNINLSFPAGELSVISGKTGTGKSLLLSALLGEVDLLQGAIYVPAATPPLERNDTKAHPGNWILPGSVAYVGQTPWLENATFRENILFGLPLIESRYQKVLEVCALKKDLHILADGDQTELGANGINLSGGQKWRVTLARAIYSRAEILILDDIFSAVDAHVGRQIYETCLVGDICKNRTRILVTHHVALVQAKAKYLVELGEGTVLNAGFTSELAEDGTLERIKSHEQPQIEIPLEEAAEASTVVNSEENSDTEGPGNANTLQKVPPKDVKKFVEEEGRDKGNVKGRIYSIYLKHAGGSFFWIILALLFAAFEAGNLGRNWWLRIWTQEETKSAQGYALINAQDPERSFVHSFSFHNAPFQTAAGPWSTEATTTKHTLSYYLWVYIAISAACGLVGTSRFIWTFTMSLKASRALFKNILFSVLRTPLRWVDTVPVGRVLNRLTADFDTIDNRLNMNFAVLLWRSLSLVGICVAALLVSPYILPLAFVLVLLAIVVAKLYLDGARPIKRLESTAKSPVFEQFNATLSGVSTLRAFQKTQTYVDRMYSHLDSWDSMSFYNSLFTRWLSFRMALIGTIFTTVIGLIIVLSPNIDASMAGFTLSFAIDFAGNILITLWSYTNLELDMNATERVIEYTEVETEPLGGEKPPAAWPTSGNVEVKNLVVGYADDLPAVLNGVSFNVSNNERIGVIGRTGAGKSSLTLALFRFLEARSGHIFIDGVDISKIDLHSLRSRLAIIPQDPVLFSGSVRNNLDPFNERTDEELRESLRRVHLVDSAIATPVDEASTLASAATSTLAPKNTNVFKDLSSGIAESGGNLSQGQRQLLCMARAIVSRPKIMVLDEATSAVDMATDTLIQRSIREEFDDSTLIVIAHRLSTIADFDRILVLSEGTVAEFGSPSELWHKEGGVFRDMCEHSGEKEKLKATILGQ